MAASIHLLPAPPRLVQYGAAIANLYSQRRSNNRNQPERDGRARHSVIINEPNKVSEGKSLDRDIIPINYITQLKTRLCELASAARGS